MMEFDRMHENKALNDKNIHECQDLTDEYAKLWSSSEALPGSVAEKAQAELNEDNDTRNSGLSQLRTLIAQTATNDKSKMVQNRFGNRV